MDEMPYESPAPRHVSPEPKPRRWGLIILWIAVGAVLLAALAGGLWLWLATGEPEEPTPPFSPEVEEVTPTLPPPNTVMVTIPEGKTVREIAALMEEKGVCAAADFLEAVQTGDFSDYAFLTEGVAEDGRVYRLEGYLYPDTYEFYKNSSGSATVRRFLDNFARKYETFKKALGESGLSLNEAVTLASIVQWEAGRAVDMPRVSRVLHNRLDSPHYPRLQCDAATRYVRALEAAEVSFNRDLYDTYVCRGLPVAAINNPGLDAIQAAIAPSEEEICAGCYFFVTDEANNTVYYSKTYAQHLAAWDAIQNGREP
ncbi:MAG: endolytic transglycosylase MltG [Clostridia bacterium]|nr:endolytic transglycosylase MltG [Clostridia bacterium]